MTRSTDAYRMREIIAKRLERIGTPGNRTEWLRKLNKQELTHAWECLQRMQHSGAEYWAGRVDLEDDTRDQLIDGMAEALLKLKGGGEDTEDEESDPGVCRFCGQAAMTDAGTICRRCCGEEHGDG